jgi:hypothetical protein
MAFEIPGETHSFEAGADLSTHQYKFVKLDSNGRVVICAAATDKPVGILQDKPAALGRVAQVMVSGVSKLVMAAGNSKADKIGTDANGLGAVYLHGTDTTKYIVGEVLEDSDAANGIGSVLFDCVSAGRAA